MCTCIRYTKSVRDGHSGLSKYSFYKFTVLCLFSRLFKQINNRQLNVRNIFSDNLSIWIPYMMLFYAFTDIFKVYLIRSVRHLMFKWKWYSLIDVICKRYLHINSYSSIKTGDVYTKLFVVCRKCISFSFSRL